MKLKSKVIIISIFVIYIGGFLSGRLIKPFRPKDIVRTEKVLDKVTLQDKYRKATQAYIDSAHKEMYNYSIRYYHTPEKLLPKYYKAIDGEKVEFSKEAFYYYYSTYKISDYLSKSKSSIIEDLLIEPKKDTI